METILGGQYKMAEGGLFHWIFHATVTTSNTNVPVVGAQYVWVYDGGGRALDFSSLPNQIVGNPNTAASLTPITYPPNTSNVFNFGIKNNSGLSQTVNWGYIRID